MILKFIVLFCVLYETAGNDEKDMDNLESLPTLKWDAVYFVEAKKYYMSSNLIENFKYWRTNTKSKLEVNDGAVIKITIGTNAGKGKYEIHPESTEEETNKMVCSKQTPSFVPPKDFLPSTKALRAQGTEKVKDVLCRKFTNENQMGKTTEKTLWASYRKASDSWIPIRYKTKEIDDWHGYLKDYEIWDYFNYDNDIDMKAFNVHQNYNCTDKDIYGNKADRKATDFFSLYLEEKKKLNDGSTYGELLKMKESQKEEPKLPSIPFPYSEAQIKSMAAQLPKEYDLRLEGLIGPVINTHDCVSAWAFAATAAVEGAVARSNGGTWIKLSEQALIDCTWGYGNKGCASGNSTTAFAWVMEHGLPTEQKYGTYANQNGFCKMANMTKTYKIKGFTYVTPLSVEALKIALIDYGPIVVRVNPILSVLYDEGVFYSDSCKSSKEYLTHYMTLVGYGEEDGDTFWILKNSKGPYTGLDGYIHISARNNNCGVMTEPTYVVA